MPASPPARSLHQDGLGRWDLPRWGGPRQSLEQQIRIIRVTTPAEYPRELVQDVKLRDGSYIHIRPIRPQDAPRLQELYGRLSRDTAYHRFFTVMKRLPPDWAQVLATVDYRRRLALVAEHDGAGRDGASLHAPRGARALGDEAREEEGGTGREAADEHGLERAPERRRAREVALAPAEDGQRRQRHEDRPRQGASRARREHVGGERDQPARDVCPADDDGARPRAGGVGVLEPELEAHHEVAPRLRAPAEGLDDGRALLGGETVRLEQLPDLLGLDLGLLRDLDLLPRALPDVVLEVTLAGQVAPQAHGDGPGGNLGDAGGDDQRPRIDGAPDSRPQRERHCETVGHADDNVPDDRARGEVVLDVRCQRHGASPAYRPPLSSSRLTSQKGPRAITTTSAASSQNGSPSSSARVALSREPLQTNAAIAV